MPTNGFSIKPLNVKLLAGEQKATVDVWLISVVPIRAGVFAGPLGTPAFPGLSPAYDSEGRGVPEAFQGPVATGRSLGGFAEKDNILEGSVMETKVITCCCPLKRELVNTRISS